jgi:hypothetical protein
MRLQYAPEEERFRAELVAWLEANAPGDESRRERKQSSAHMPEWSRAWQRKLFDNGWLVPGWPPELGGRNASPTEQMIYFEEMNEREIARSANPQGLGIIAPSIKDYGTPEQQAKFLLPTLRAEIAWCLGMSEPNAGSDLASLRTRAELVGDEFVVNGQKVWTSGAHHSDWCLCFVRTDPDAPKHKGISALIIDVTLWGSVLILGAEPQRYPQSGFYPRLGLTYQPSVDEVWRLAYQDWLRPNAAKTLSPVATAGVTLDDQVVLPGGELERLRIQFEKEMSAATFVSLFLDTKRIHNLGQPGNVLNQGDEVANLDRLRNRSILILRGSGEILEQPSIFLQGKINSAGMSISQRLGDTLSGYANYVHTESENTSRFFAGFALPFMPRHRFTFGVNWVGPERLLLQAQTIYRTSRFTDEIHSDQLPAGWDATVKATWQSADKRWLLEGFATNMLKKDTPSSVGVNAVWRY